METSGKHTCGGDRRTAWTVYERDGHRMVGVWIACCADSACAKAILDAEARTISGEPGSALLGWVSLYAVERHPLA